MDFAQLDYVLEHIASRHRVEAQEVLDKWLERRRVHDPDRWRLLDGIPCIVGGLTALLGPLEGRGGNFPWKTLPTVLARHGCILGNYLENILMPGESRATLAKSKGIHDLSLHEWRILVDALKNNALTVKSIATDAHKSLMASRIPVIVEEAPITDSPHTCGQRGFANGQIDRLGLTHLDNTSPSTSHAMSSNRRRLCVFIEVPLTPPSWRSKVIRQCSPWRLKAIQQRSLVFGPNHSDLIPQIAVIKGNGVEGGAIKDGAIDDEETVSNITADEEEIDELLGSQEWT
ncbi:hypothetical protein DFH29DRAFT_1005651 [Suillus ampliporus]|nr:hypothetical protein DFH29DRAFT_1005651 [Suillus ampliporus]